MRRHMWTITLVLIIFNKVSSQELDDGFNYECRLKSRPESILLQSPNQGKPGKRGPVGPLGPKGSKGETSVIDYDRIVQDVNQHLLRISQTECSSIGINGVSTIYTSPYESEGLRVYCDTSTDGGRWIVFQRRENGIVDFYRTWKEYVNGFGSQNGEFWLGLETLHQLTQRSRYELLIEMEDFDGNKKWAKYNTFSIGNAESKYTLTVNGFSGTAGDSFSNHNGYKFTTKDEKNDVHPSVNCAVSYLGAWWYTKCHSTNLNGKYYEGGESNAKGVTWNTFGQRYYSLKFVEMKIRRIIPSQ